jgi:lipoyl(octanoyl) transferase
VTARPLWIIRAGTVPYAEAVALQERVHRARREGRVPDVLLLLQHPPVITLGRGARSEHLLADPERLERLGVEVHETARGGDVTYHGPGQLVGYPIFSLDEHRRDVHWYLRAVEEALIRALERFGIAGERAPGLTGVWVGREKVAAIGIGVRNWVTWHGFALNVSTDLDAFGLIVPCGIRDRSVTSLERLLGRPVGEEEAAEAVIGGLADVFELEPQPRSLLDL